VRFFLKDASSPFLFFVTSDASAADSSTSKTNVVYKSKTAAKEFHRRFNDASSPTESEESLVLRRSVGYSAEYSERRQCECQWMVFFFFLLFRVVIRVSVEGQQQRRWKKTRWENKAVETETPFFDRRFPHHHQELCPKFEFCRRSPK
jgi:hypothetical protein